MGVNARFVTRRSKVLAGLAAMLVAVAISWVAQNRPDPGGVPGAKSVSVMLLTADARLQEPITDDAAELALRAARLRDTWAPSELRSRAARLPAPTAQPQVTIRAFVPQSWGEAKATPHRATVYVTGGFQGAVESKPVAVHTYRVEMSRGDPGGITRGWRLVSITTS